jgi:type I restriction enzyme, S subunit
MKQGWEVKRLKDLLEVQNGYAFASSLFSASEGMPLIRIRDLKNGVNTKVNFTGEYSKDYIVQKGDFLIGMDGEFRCYEWAGGNALLNQRVCRLQNFEDSLLPKFLFYGVNKHLKDIEDVTSFTTVKHISSKKIKDIEFPIPPLEEQKQIVAKLDQCFEAIDKAKANAAKNLENAKELFQSKLNEIFSQKGEGWVEKKLGAACLITMGQSPKGTSYNQEGEGVPLINGPVEFGKDSFDKTIKSKFTTEPTKMCRQGDLILCVRGSTTGKINIAGFDACIGRGVASIRFDQNQRWLDYFIRSKRNEIYSLGTGSTFPNVSRTILSKLPFLIPPVEQQNRLVETMNKLLSSTNLLQVKYQQELNSLEELKKSILQKAFEGEL